LPAPGELNQTLRDVLGSRRSRRDYSPVALSLKQVSTLLHYSYGTTGRVVAYGYNNGALRPAPSSGALQSTELYFFAQHVEGLQPGLYHFDCSNHALDLIKPGFNASVMRGWVPGQPLAADAPIIFVFSGCDDRLRWKYGARSYRYMCMDIGFVCENLYLVAEAMGLAFCAVAGFIEDELENYLEIDGQGEMALLVASLGPRD
jgi:SagB-type dehydrogenase family enzyme